ncbi:MAG: hypothetical protein NT005_17505 [Spirochaetes bacterium]|nr:hypothetical protein [Spirochaetota bacterium]
MIGADNQALEFLVASRRLAVESAACARLVRVVSDNRLSGQIQIEYWEDPSFPK